MNNRSVHSLFPPLLIGIVSALGLCLVAMYVWLPRPNTQASPTETATPFKFMLVSTETPIVTETPPTEELVLPVVPTSAGFVPGIASTSERGAETAAPAPGTTHFVPATADSRECTPATVELMEPIVLAVASADTNNRVTTAWTVVSNDVVQLTIVSAKIRLSGSASANTLPGVWALIVYDDGGFNTYSINEIAQQYSYAALGTDFLPPLTMSTDGAQLAYDCALGSP